MTAPQLVTASAALHPCRCVKSHSPKVNRTQIHHIWPQGMGGPDTAANKIPLCPTTHSEVHLVMEAFDRAGRVTPRKGGWGQYAYDLAVRGWSEWDKAGRP